MPLATRMREAAAGVGGGPLAFDSFTRADSASTMGTTETGGFAWSTLNGSTWGISSNQAYCASATAGGLAVVNVGVTDMTVSAKINTTVVSDASGIEARVTDGSNGYLTDDLNNSIRVFAVVAGSFNSLGSGGAIAVGDTLAIAVQGTSVIVKKNGTQVLSTTDSTVTASGTKAGLRCGAADASQRWDDFTVTSP